MKKLMMIINNAIYNNKIKVLIHNINKIRKNNNLNDNQSVNSNRERHFILNATS